MGLQSEWQRIEELTRAYHTAVSEERAEAAALWHERQQRLQSLLNESAMSALNARDRQWLAERVDSLRQQDATLKEALQNDQSDIMGRLRQQAGNRKAAAAYNKNR